MKSIGLQLGAILLMKSNGYRWFDTNETDQIDHRGNTADMYIDDIPGCLDAVIQKQLPLESGPK